MIILSALVGVVLLLVAFDVIVYYCCMALTKKDLAEIKSIVAGTVLVEIENLARIVAKGFESVDKRFEQVDKRFEQADKRSERLESEIRHMSAEMGTMQQDVAEIRKHFVYRDEFEDALARILLLEKTVGIKSGKNHRS